ncbi:MAG: glycerol-3-phosphate acyltransferase [bacterium]
MELALILIACYLIGSIPVAYLITKKRAGIDLRSSGSRNIGARNAYETTGNKRLGFVILVLDMHKAIILLVILSRIGYSDAVGIAAVAIMLGHCYPIFLKFHGGRGLATAAAISLMFNPIFMAIWFAGYFITGIFQKQVHIQSVVATVCCLVVELLKLSDFGFGREGIIEVVGDLHIAWILIFLIILSRHIQPFTSHLKIKNG